MKSELHRRQHFMKKLNLIKQPPLSDIETQLHQPLPAVSKKLDTNVPIMTLSYAELLHQLEAQKQLAVQLTRDVQAERALRKINTFAPRPRII